MPRIRHVGFKRKRQGLGVRAFKRRRVIRGVRRRSTAFSSVRGNTSSFFFRRRRFNARKFRRTIFRNSQYSTHYRSIGSVSGSQSTPVGSSTVNTGFLGALDNGAGAFWTSAGGLQPVDTGIAVPLFKGDITVRGGVIGFRVYNDGAYPMQVKLWLVMTKDTWVTNSGNYSLTGVPLSWDPSVVPDFRRDLSFIKSWEFNIHQLDMNSIEFRIRPMKVDENRWSSDVARLYWLFTIGDGDVAGQDNARIVSYFNISLSADAIGTT